MNLFNRFLLAVFAVLWVGALAVGMVLVWEQERAIDWRTASWVLSFDITLDAQAEQVLATLVIAALMLPAIALLLAEVLVRGRPMRDERRAAELAARNRELERQLAAEQSRALPAASDEVAASVHEQNPERQRGFRFLPGRR